MKLRKILAGFLAGAVAMGSMVFSAGAAEGTNTTLYEFVAGDADVFSTLVLNDAAATAINGATSSVVISVTSENTTNNFYLQSGQDWECFGWSTVGTDLTLDTNTVNGNSKNFISDKATGAWQIVFSASTKVEKVTVTADGGSAVTGFDAATDCPSGVEFGNWADSLLIEASTLANAGLDADNLATSKVTITVKDDTTTEDAQQVGIKAGWTDVEIKNVEVTSATDVEITFTDSASAILTDGLRLCGKNLIMTKAVLTVVEPTEETEETATGFDQTEEAVEEAAANGTVLMQTATFGDVEAVRYTKVVSLEEIKKAAKVVFTFETNDGRTGTYESTNYYKSLVASGDTVIAPSGYGFLSLTVTDIPDGVTLTCTGIELHFAN